MKDKILITGIVGTAAFLLAILVCLICIGFRNSSNSTAATQVSPIVQENTEAETPPAYPLLKTPAILFKSMEAFEDCQTEIRANENFGQVCYKGAVGALPIKTKVEATPMLDGSDSVLILTGPLAGEHGFIPSYSLQ